MPPPSRYCHTCLSAATSSLPFRSALRNLPPPFLLPFSQTQVRTAADKTKPRSKKKDAPRKKARATFLTPDLKQALQFPLADAMRYAKQRLESRTHLTTDPPTYI